MNPCPRLLQSMTPRQALLVCPILGSQSILDSTSSHGFISNWNKGSGFIYSIRILFYTKLTGLHLPSLDLTSVTPVMMAVTLSAGPVILAQTMANITDKNKSRSIFYPFHKVRTGILSSQIQPLFLFLI